jgi:hypothetical protein
MTPCWRLRRITRNLERLRSSLAELVLKPTLGVELVMTQKRNRDSVSWPTKLLNYRGENAPDSFESE